MKHIKAFRTLAVALTLALLAATVLSTSALAAGDLRLYPDEGEIDESEIVREARRILAEGNGRGADPGVL